MDYEDAARKLVTYSRAFAKGGFSPAYGLSVGEMPVLEQLVASSHGVIPSKLAKDLGYTRSRMTRILDGLEAKGYVEREADTADRRRVIVRVTEEGRRHAERKRADGVGELAAALSALGESDVSELVRVLERAYRITYNDDPSEGARALEQGLAERSADGKAARGDALSHEQCHGAESGSGGMGTQRGAGASPASPV